jgi:LmbE family N-acetylglucosaminyl deacetylase
MRLVTVGAHQDDMEVWALGTVLRYKERGDLEHLTVVCLTNGDKGSATPVDSAAYAATRASEAEAVATALGGRYVGLGVEDEYLYDTKEIREQLVRVVREARPDVILTPCIDDLNNTDHATAGKIAIQVALLAQVGTICTDIEPLPISPVVYEWEPAVGLGFVPQIYVDITSVQARKLELLGLHTSQVQATEDLYATGLLGMAEVCGRYRGLQCGVGYAEGFRQVLSWPRTKPGNLLP